jgi:hypothetical protein
MIAASPTTLPARRPITVPRLSAERRAIKLAWLAREVIARPQQWNAEAVQILLGAWASDSLSGEALDRAFAEYADTVRLEIGVTAGTVSWQEITQALEGTDLQAAACRLAGELAARALAVLIRGNEATAVTALTVTVTALAPPGAAQLAWTGLASGQPPAASRALTRATSDSSGRS